MAVADTDGVFRIRDRYGNEIRVFTFHNDVALEVSSRQTWYTPAEANELLEALAEVIETTRAKRGNP